jgi:hypothetical protein
LNMALESPLAAARRLPKPPHSQVYRREPNPAEQQQYCRSRARNCLPSPRTLPAGLTIQGLVHSFNQRVGISAEMKLAHLDRLAARERLQRIR